MRSPVVRPWRATEPLAVRSRPRVLGSAELPCAWPARPTTCVPARDLQLSSRRAAMVGAASCRAVTSELLRTPFSLLVVHHPEVSPFLLFLFPMTTSLSLHSGVLVAVAAAIGQRALLHPVPLQFVCVLEEKAKLPVGPTHMHAARMPPGTSPLATKEMECMSYSPPHPLASCDHATREENMHSHSRSYPSWHFPIGYLLQRIF
jgi:hypothetical protein